MKKRCTDSACRRVFSLPAEACPYCGKGYPRLPKAPSYYVVLSPTRERVRARAIFLYRRTAVERLLPSEIRHRLETQTHRFGPLPRGEAIEACRAWRDADIPAALELAR